MAEVPVTGVKHRDAAPGRREHAPHNKGEAIEDLVELCSPEDELNYLLLSGEQLLEQGFSGTARPAALHVEAPS